MVRRLPVLQDQPAPDAEADRRSPGTWVFYGTVLTLLLWLALATAAGPAGAFWAARWYRVQGGDWSGVDERVRQGAALLSVVPLIVAFGVSAALSAGVLGRFAGRGTRVHAVLSAVAAATAACLLTIVAGGPMEPGRVLLAQCVLAGAGMAGALAGWRWGRIRRQKRAGLS